MKGNGQNRQTSGTDGALRWAGRVVTADGLRASLNGECELVVTAWIPVRKSGPPVKVSWPLIRIDWAAI